MQSFMLSSKSAQFLEYMELRTRTTYYLHSTIHVPAHRVAHITRRLFTFKQYWTALFTTKNPGKTGSRKQENKYLPYSKTRRIFVYHKIL